METVDLIPYSISANTRAALTKAMFLNNVKHGAHFRYFDIAKVGKEWIAWYYKKIKNMDIIEQRGK